MSALHPNLRNKLEKAVVAARDEAEAAARAALERLAVDRPKPFEHLDDVKRLLRNKLRAHARQVGDKLKKNGAQEITHLVGECAYEHWHRMLFARFLAENSLLMHPEGVAVTLEECDELAAEQGTDRWTLAAEYASRMLPQIFRPDDPLLQVTLAPEDKRTLERLVAGLPADVFTADDSLGWCYQFWQNKRKEEVNKSEVKIGADELPAVTQLFTEDYMVRFLLHNSLGAWWSGKQNPSGNTEDQLRKALSNTLEDYDFDYLRFIENDGTWKPAAGTLDGWPSIAAELKILDPCCGSGHFLVAVFELMARIRMAEEGLSRDDATDTVIRDNLFGLEIDPRCTQLAAFSVAMAAWRFCGGYRPLPPMNIACSGLAPNTPKERWLELAGDNERLSYGLETLYDLFQQAPTLGSLIDPSRSIGDDTLFTATFSELHPLLAKAFRDPSDGDGFGDSPSGLGDGSGYGDGRGGTESAFDPTNLDHREMGITARGIADAARLLADKYHLVITNVPYRASNDLSPIVNGYIEQCYDEGKSNLATGFSCRCLNFLLPNSIASLVTPQDWLFQPTYQQFRRRILHETTPLILNRLGPRAFQTISGEVVNVLLTCIESRRSTDNRIQIIDSIEGRSPQDKALLTQTANISSIGQAAQLDNPGDSILVSVTANGATLLGKCIASTQGIKTGDDGSYKRGFWELVYWQGEWRPMQSTTSDTCHFSGLSYIVFWGQKGDHLARKQGMAAWGKVGISVSQMSSLPCSFYLGGPFDSNVSVLAIKEPSFAAAVANYALSGELSKEVRRIDQSIKPTNSTYEKVQFASDYWLKQGPFSDIGDFPKPYSDDPTQWIFHGRPDGAETNEDGISAPLHVAVARLLGYRWPAELDEEMELSDEARTLVGRCDELLNLVDDDGIVGIPPVRGELPAADRVREMLARAYGDQWSPVKAGELLAEAGFANKTLDQWLRDGFFKQHCKLFQNRPFIWHIWDGHKTGFQALVNYHCLADGQQGYKLLQTLAFTYLGDWIRQLETAQRGGDGTAETRLIHARALQENLNRILDGESPYDIFVRWKPLAEQPIGWHPDLNDGVRLNIRPFLTVEQPGSKKGCGVLREKPNINWNKDRGKDVESAPWYNLGPEYGGNPGDRINDHHLTLEEKQKAKE